jgi:hypothetical protein
VAKAATTQTRRSPVRLKEEWTTIRVKVTSRDRLTCLRSELTEAWQDQPHGKAATLDDVLRELLDVYALWNGKEASR